MGERGTRGEVRERGDIRTVQILYQQTPYRRRLGRRPWSRLGHKTYVVEPGSSFGIYIFKMRRKLACVRILLFYGQTHGHGHPSLCLHRLRFPLRLRLPLDLRPRRDLQSPKYERAHSHHSRSTSRVRNLSSSPPVKRAEDHWPQGTSSLTCPIVSFNSTYAKRKEDKAYQNSDDSPTYSPSHLSPPQNYSNYSTP